MFSSLAWRGKLLYYWFARGKENVGFLLMLGVPVCILASLVYFAYSDGIRLNVKREHQETARQRDSQLLCLAENVYFEARGEPMSGQYAVAEVTMNRVASRYFPRTICEVVHEKHWDSVRRRHVAAFSWTQMPSKSQPRGAAWEQAMAAATAVYYERHTHVVPGALFYHATYVDPYWAKSRKRVATIGNHIFYR